MWKSGGRLSPRRWLARLPTSTLAKIAPKMAVPNDPPMDREEGGPRGRHAQFRVWHSVLHDYDQYLHDAAEAGTEHDHVERLQGQGGARAHSREQVQPECGEG